MREAAGARLALVQAGLWIFSYALYLIYTTASIVYDTLPAVTPGITPYQPYLEIAIPVVLAAIMLAGRAVTIAVLGVLAVGQLALVAVLAVVTLSHDHPAGSFALQRPSPSLAARPPRSRSSTSAAASRSTSAARCEGRGRRRYGAGC